MSTFTRHCPQLMSSMIRSPQSTPVRPRRLSVRLRSLLSLRPTRRRRRRRLPRSQCARHHL